MSKAAEKPRNMDQATRNELLKTIEQQKDQLTRYETRLRDVVRAYKGMSKEKEALEATVKVLSNSTGTPPPPRCGNAGGKKPESPSESERESEVDDDKDPTKVGDPLNAKALSLESLDDDQSKVREQVATLSASLSTLMQEKSRMEANFQADKKKIRQEHEEEVHKLKDCKDEQGKQLEDLQTQLNEVKGRLRSAQHEREREQQDHQLMLRELQKLLAQERMAKEGLEQQLDDSRQQLSERDMTADLSQHYEKRIHDLSNELETVRQRLQRTEEQAAQPSPLLRQLQKDMADMKAQHRIALQQEQRRANESESRLRASGTAAEERVAALETKLKELSEVVGDYERLRFQDQQAISKLRERVTQLDLENTALARAAHPSSDVDADNEDSNLNNMDVTALVDKIVQLKGRLKLANEKSEKPIDIDELLLGGEAVELESEKVHQKCHEEYQYLKEEFERYKLRAQSVLKNKSTKETSGNKEADQLKTQVTELKERVRMLHMDNQEQETTCRGREESLRKTLVALQESHAQELQACKADYKQRTTELELEIRKHRERTISLLAEKDRELETLRAKSPEHYHSQYVTSFNRLTSQSEHDIPEIGASSEESAVAQLLSRSNTGSGMPVETSLLHFAQEQARKDVEIQTLRKHKHVLETTMRELQHTATIKQAKLHERIEFLQEEVRKFERNISRESANLEYLKNVVYQYMVCYDVAGKHQMLNAISTILQFSPKEKDSVHAILKSGWWSSGTYASSRVK